MPNMLVLLPSLSLFVAHTIIQLTMMNYSQLITHQTYLKYVTDGYIFDVISDIELLQLMLQQIYILFNSFFTQLLFSFWF